MSIIKDKRSPFWRYDFQMRGRHFFGSTKVRTRREAEAVERAERERARLFIEQTEAVNCSLRIDDVAGRYWHEVGQYHAGADNTERQIKLLIEHFGKDKLIIDITDADVIKLVA